MKNKVLVLVIGSFLLVGCGSGSDSGSDSKITGSGDITDNGGNVGGGGSTSSGGESISGDESSIPTIQTGQGIYFDSAINGVNYECGSKTGITGDSGVAGSFTFEVDKDCLFTINGFGMTAIVAAGLIDGVKVRPNHEVARYLQSLDDDANVSNGINILPVVIQALKDKNILGLQREDQDVKNMVSALSGVTGYKGSYITMKVAGEHLAGFSVDLTADKQSYRFGDSVTFDAGTDVGDLIYEWKEGNTTIGSGNPFLVENFSIGSHNVDLTITSENGSVINTSITITVGEAYDHMVNIISSKQTYTSAEQVTLTANVTSAEGDVTYLWKEGSDELGTDRVLNRTFTAGEHTVSVDASANNLTKSSTITFTVSEILNSAPIANAGSDISVDLNTTFTLDGSASSDDVSITKYEWIFNGVVLNSDTSSPIHTMKFNDNSGDHNITLRVIDEDNLAGEDTIVVYVN